MAVRGWLWAAWVAAANVASRRAGKWGTWTIFLLLLLLVCSHDGVGNRVSKSVNGSTTKYLVEDDVNPTGYPQVFDELTNGAVTRTYAYGLQRIDEEQVVDNAWTTSYYGYDGFGTVRQLTNSAGAVTDSFEYDAFGNQITHTGTTPNNYLYRGEQYDSDLGLYYLRARYYNPATGRFMSMDPQQHDPITPLLPFTYHSRIIARKPLDPIRWHRYLYANANPVNMLDPSGRDAEETAGADEESIELTEKTIEEIKETSFVDKFTDIDTAMEQLESLEDNLSYCDEGYCASGKKSLDALINIAKTLKFLP